MGNIRMVIGSSSTGGDTYLASSIMAKELERELKTSIKVDAVGAIEAFKLLQNSRDGHTIMVFHDQSYLGHIYQHNGYPDIFKEFIVGSTFAINPGNAYLVPKKSKIKSFGDVLAKLKNRERVRVAIQSGGVSEIGFSAMKNAAKLEHLGMEKYLVTLKTGSQSDLNQQLFDGQADIIYGSVQANEAYTHLPETDPKAMRFLWLTASKEAMMNTRVQGYGKTTRMQLLEKVTPNVQVPLDASQNFVFDKEFFFLFNRHTDPKIIQLYESKIAQVFEGGSIQQILSASFFSPNHRSFKASAAYLKKKSESIRTLLSDIQTSSHASDLKMSSEALWPVKINPDQSHLFFPKLLGYGCLMVLCLILLKQLMAWPGLLKAFRSCDLNWCSLKMIVCLIILMLYFYTMTWVGGFFPNRGFGFLFSSVPVMFLLSYLFIQKRVDFKQHLAIGLTSVITPCVSWLVFTQLLGISLP